MRKYRALYAVNPTLDDELLSLALLGYTHVFVREVEAPSPEAAWREMQGENWSPNGEARALIKGLGLHHTSMSVGDVLQDTETGTFWQCMMCGWRKIE